MLRALEDGGSADLEGGAAGGDDQLDVLIAVVHDLGDAVMQEADADDALTGADVLGGTGAGLGVNLNVLVQVDQVLDALVVAVLLDHGVDDQLGGTGGVVVGQPDQALVFGLLQILPVGGSFQVHTSQLILVDHEAQDALVNAVPVAVGIPVLAAQQVGSVLSFVGFQQALSSDDVVGVGGAAKPGVSGRIAVFFLDLGLNLTGGQALILNLDAVQLFKVSAGSCQIVFLAGAVDDQLALSLGCVDQGLLGSSGLRCRSRGIGGRGSRSRLGSRGRCIAAAGCQRSNHQNGHQNCKNLFHRLCFLHLLILLRKFAYLKRTSFRMLTLYTGDFVLSIGVISYFSRLLGASG